MFGSIRRVLGSIKVTQTAKDITIDGIPADVMTNDIARIWRTSRINANMFSRASKNSLTFPLFFAPDVLYMLESMSDTRSRRVSVRTLSKIRDLLLKETWLADTQLEPKPRMDLSKLRNMIYTPKDYQQTFFENYDRLTQQYHLNGYLLAASAGSGKAQPLDAKIKIPGGWSTMGEMTVGTIVTAPDGSNTKVTGIYPQGEKSVFKITFADGRTTRACKEHLWKVYDRACYRNEAKGWSVVNTIELMSLLAKKRSMIYVPLANDEEIEDIELPIDPYTMGVILGDGGISSNFISISTPDQEIFDRIQLTLPESLSFIRRDNITQGIITTRGTPNIYIRTLKELGLMGTTSKTKFIPEVYLNASRDQRIALIQGLMDTDGFIDTQGTSNYSSSSYKLASQVQYLIRSIGGIAKITSRHPTYTYLGVKKNGATSWRVNIRYSRPSELFSITKKKERTNDKGQYCENLRLRVIGVEYDRLEEAQCISVDHPDKLYVTDDFIVTHNTFVTLAMAECLGSDLVIVICPKNATERVWEAEIKKLFKKTQTYWIHQHKKPYTKQRFAVFHYEALKDALAMAESGELKGQQVMVILDESHNLNEVSSARTNIYLQLVKAVKARDIIPASGTAVKNAGQELIPLLTSIDPYFTDDARERYKRIYGRDGNRAYDILNHRMGLISYKVEKSQLGLDKPILKELKVTIPNGKDYTLDNIRLDMSRFIEERFAYYKARLPQDQAMYDKCLAIHKDSLRSPAQLNEFQKYKDTVKLIQRYKGDARQVGAEIKWSNVYEKNAIHPSIPQTLRNDFKDVKSVIKYVNLKIQGEALGRILGRKRIQCHVDMIPHIDFKSVCESTAKKTVVFTSFVEALEASDKSLTEKGMNPLTVYGKTNNDLNNTIRSFEKNEELNPLLATFQSLSTAVPLVMADTMIMIDSPFRSYIREQAISRIHRLGADTQTIVYEASLDTGNEPNISTRSSDILAWSQAQVSAILGHESPFAVTTTDGGISISTEDYDISETINVKDICRDAVVAPVFLNW